MRLILSLFILSLYSCGKDKDIKYVDVAHNEPTGKGALYWSADKFPIKIIVPDEFESDTRLKSALINASETWNNAMLAVVGGPVFDTIVFSTQYNNKVTGTIKDYLMDSISSFNKKTTNWFCDKPACRPDEENILAITAYAYRSVGELDSVLEKGDFIFNYYKYGTYYNNGSIDLESVILHEMGHFLGYKHSSDNTSVMKASLSLYEKKTALSTSDFCRINENYGHLLLSKPSFECDQDFLETKYCYDITNVSNVGIRNNRCQITECNYGYKVRINDITGYGDKCVLD